MTDFYRTFYICYLTKFSEIPIHFPPFLLKFEQMKITYEMYIREDVLVGEAI
ncbi:hypothetical protein AB1K81_09010 [Ornithinibacillus sp. 179-J 7C1 HS]